MRHFAEVVVSDARRGEDRDLVAAFDEAGRKHGHDPLGASGLHRRGDKQDPHRQRCASRRS